MAFIIKREKFDRDVEEDMKFVKDISDALELMYKDGHPNVKKLDFGERYYRDTNINVTALAIDCKNGERDYSFNITGLDKHYEPIYFTEHDNCLFYLSRYINGIRTSYKKIPWCIPEKDVDIIKKYIYKKIIEPSRKLKPYDDLMKRMVDELNEISYVAGSAFNSVSK